MLNDYYQYALERGINSSKMKVLNTMIRTPKGQKFTAEDAEQNQAVQELLTDGFLAETETEVVMTKKSYAFLHTLLTLAKENGEF